MDIELNSGRIATVGDTVKLVTNWGGRFDTGDEFKIVETDDSCARYAYEGNPNTIQLEAIILFTEDFE